MNKFIIKSENNINAEIPESDLKQTIQSDNLLNDNSQNDNSQQEENSSNTIENTYTLNGLNLLCDPKKKKI